MNLLLEASEVGKRFGGLDALIQVSLSIGRGEIYGLIGPNGAGKTTFFNVLTGLYPPDGGDLVFDGRALPVAEPHRVAAAGIARTFQNVRLFANMSALENVMVGRHVRTRAGVVGAVLLAAMPEVFRNTIVPVQQQLFGKIVFDPEVVRMLLFGLALVLVMLFRPAGIWPSTTRKREFAR